MPNRHVTAARARLAATLLSALAASPASAARIVLYSLGNESYVCQAHTWTVDGALTVSPYETVSSIYPSELQLGALAPAPEGDSPQFGRVEMRCWVRDRHTSGNPPQSGERGYSIALDRSNTFWEWSDPDHAAPLRSLPRDGTTVLLYLRAAGNAQAPTQINVHHAKSCPALIGPADACDDYDLVTTPRLLLD